MAKAEKFYLVVFALALASLPVLAVTVPRVLAFIPAIVGIAGYASFYPVFKERATRSVFTFVSVAVLMALMFLSSLWSIDPEISLERAQKTSLLLIGGAFFVSIALSIRITALEPYLKWLPYVLFAAAALTSIEVSLDHPLYRLVRGEAMDVMVNNAVCNRAAVTIVLLLVPALVMMRHFHNAQICLLAVLLTVVPLMFITQSQSALLGLLVAGLTYFAFPYRLKYVYLGAAAVVGALMLALPFIAMWVFQNWAADINNMPLLGQNYGYAGARLEIWDFISRYIMQNPLYGFGVEATRMVEDFGSAELYHKGKSILHPHNFTLQLWMEFGLVGVLAGIAFITALLLRIGRLPPRQARIMLSTLFATLAVASTSYGLWQGWWLGLLFALAAAAILALRIARQDSGYTG